MKITVTGAEGQLGREFCRQLGASALPLDLPEFDMTDRDQVQRTMRVLRPDAIINCAAYTQVDRAEREAEVCHQINADAVQYLVQAAITLDCPLVQISTDYVFGADAARHSPYVETDPPGPLGVYAQSKLAGEQYARGTAKHLIVRTCGLYGDSPRGNNFVETMLRLGAERDRLHVVDDQHCTPSYVVHVSRAVLFLLGTGAYGTYHIVNAGSTSWYEFAREIFRLAKMDVVLERITSEQFVAPAPRPRYSVLDTRKYQSLGGPALPPWREAVAEYLAARTKRLPR
jgi:dTDP-4-dehydrorhamnose reductase